MSNLTSIKPATGVVPRPSGPVKPIAIAEFDHKTMELRLGSQHSWKSSELLLGQQLSKPDQFKGIAGAIEAANKLSKGAAPGVAVVWTGDKHALLSLQTNSMSHTQHNIEFDQPGKTHSTLEGSKAFAWTDLATAPFVVPKTEGYSLAMVIDDGKVWAPAALGDGFAGPKLLTQTSNWDLYLN